MASRPEDSTPETKANSPTESVSEEDPQSSYDEWDHLISEEDLHEVYDTIIEIYDDFSHLETSGIKSVNDEVLLPEAEAYDGEGESLEALREKLDGNSLVVAFGFDGEDFPNYNELLDEDVLHEGNWWDNPEELDTDYLFDRTTYTGAVNAPRSERRHVFASEGVNKDVYLLDLS